MNPSNLIARSARKPEIGEDFHAPETAIDHRLDATPEAETVGEESPHQLAADVRNLRLAVAQLLARQTSQDIAVFQGPVVDNRRLCAIADNIWNHRRWSA